MDEQTARLIARSEALGRWYQEVGDLLCGAQEPTEHDVSRYRQMAEKLRNLDPAAALKLATMLIDAAAEHQTDIERQMWGKVERAAGYEPGSLTGKLGVKQRVFL
jgi:hypothetical protein